MEAISLMVVERADLDALETNNSITYDISATITLRACKVDCGTLLEDQVGFTAFHLHTG